MVARRGQRVDIGSWRIDLFLHQVEGSNPDDPDEVRVNEGERR